jgi:hypothetical protein
MKHRHPLTPKNAPEIVFLVTASVTTLSIAATQIQYTENCTEKSASFDDRSATVFPIDFRSTAIDASETPAPFDVEKPHLK